MSIEIIFKNNQEWAQNKLSQDEKYFEELSSGQAPQYLYIGCSDSRVVAETLMGLQPGEVFVHRNIANMVSNTDLNGMSVINYAVSHLQVKHIIVCGHYGCGGVKAAMQNDDMGLLNPWLKNIKDVYRLHQTELHQIEKEEDRYRRLIELNVQEQCMNVMKNPEVQKAYHGGQLKVHAWVFDMATGRLIDLKIDLEGLFQEMMNVYRLS